MRGWTRAECNDPNFIHNSHTPRRPWSCPTIISILCVFSLFHLWTYTQSNRSARLFYVLCVRKSQNLFNKRNLPSNIPINILFSHEFKISLYETDYTLNMLCVYSDHTIIVQYFGDENQQPNDDDDDDFWGCCTLCTLCILIDITTHKKWLLKENKKAKILMRECIRACSNYYNVVSFDVYIFRAAVPPIGINFYDFSLLNKHGRCYVVHVERVSRCLVNNKYEKYIF